MTERAEMVDYKTAQARGWDIGSGPTEAQCKVTPTRLKIGGAKWTGDNPEGIMNIIAMTNSGQADTYWHRLAA